MFFKIMLRVIQNNSIKQPILKKLKDAEKTENIPYKTA